MSSLPAPAPTPTTFLNRKRASPTLSEPDSLITPPASITSSIASRYSQIHNQNDGGTRVPAADFQIQVDFKRGLWGFCGSKEQNVGRCWMPGVCYDGDQCKDGCGNLDRKDLDVAKCSSKDDSGKDIRVSICATAFLTLDNNLGPFQYIACGWTTTRAHYTASQADAAQNPLASTTTTSLFSSSSLSSSFSSSLVSPLPSQTTTTLPNPTATSTNPASTTAANNNGGSSSNSNIGAIVGGIIGGLTIICAFIFAAWFVWVYRVRDRRKQQAQSQPLNGSNTDGSGRSSSSHDGNTPSLGHTSNHVPLGYSPDGQVQQGYGPVSGVSPASAHGAGHPQEYGQGQGYGIPFVSMSEMQQQRTMVKDTEGGWGPRELDVEGAGAPGFAHVQQRQEYYGPHEVLSTEKATELPVGIEVAELSSGWEDTHGRDEHGDESGRTGRDAGRR